MRDVDWSVLMFLMFVIGFGMGLGTMYFQVHNLEVWRTCECECQHYIEDPDCVYNYQDGWVCYN